MIQCRVKMITTTVVCIVCRVYSLRRIAASPVRSGAYSDAQYSLQCHDRQLLGTDRRGPGDCRFRSALLYRLPGMGTYRPGGAD
jgi:hypothetical protein